MLIPPLLQIISWTDEELYDFLDEVEPPSEDPIIKACKACLEFYRNPDQKEQLVVGPLLVSVNMQLLCAGYSVTNHPEGYVITVAPLTNTYVTFGQIHRHEVNGVVFDKDCVALIKNLSSFQGRKLAFDVFGPKFFTVYSQAPDMTFFPRGLVKLETEEWTT